MTDHMAPFRRGDRRVCVEFLPPRELGRRDVMELLLSTGVAPMLAAPVVDAHPAVQAEADGLVMQVLAEYRRSGLSPCVWPLLADQDGYWPSVHNAERFVCRMRALMAAATLAGAPFSRGDFVAVDLEPPLSAVRGGWSLLKGCDRERFSAAQGVFSDLAHELRGAGLRTVAIAYPPVSAEGTGRTFWQRRFVAPLHCGWDRVAVMTYSSMMSGYSRGLFDVRAARRYGYRAQQALSAAFPGRAGSFIGICGHGKLGNETAHTEPEMLREDAAAAWAGGAVEVTAFCLEGILAQRNPRAWLHALSAPPRAPAASLRGEMAHVLLSGLSRVLRSQ